MKVSARLAAILAVVILCGFLTACGGSNGGSITPTAPSITTTSLPAGTVGTAYSTTIVAMGGTAPYTFAVTTGTLPTGLALSTGGVISGTPTAAGTSPFTVTVTDSEATPRTATAMLSITISAQSSTLTITTTTLPAGAVGAAYSATVMATGGKTPYTFTISAGTLPAGLSISATTGAITGTPTTAGTSPFTVKVTDSSSPVQTATAVLSITINAVQTLTITTTNLPAGTVGTAYSATVTATGGITPYTFSIISGTLPAGLTLSASGTISGTPQTAGTSDFTVQVADSETPPMTATAPLSIAISGGPLTITSPATLPGAIVNVPYNYQLTASGGTPPYTWTLQAGSTLPTGLSLSTAGVISGTPTTPVTNATFSIGVTDSSNPQQSASQTFTLTVAPAAVLSGQYTFQIYGLDFVTTPPNAPTPAAYIGTFTADGNGNITAGADDVNANGTTTQNVITVGTYSLQSGGNTGEISVTYVGGTTDTFAYSISATSTNGSIMLYNSGTAISFGIGTFQSATSSDFSLTAIAGDYAFGLVGNQQTPSNNRSGTVGRFTVDSSGNLTNTAADLNEAGNFTASQSLTGSFAAPDPTTGRGTGSFTVGPQQINFAYYIVNQGVTYIMEEGQGGGLPLFAGTMQTQQNPGQYSNASYSGASVMALYGVDTGGAVGFAGELTATSTTLAGEYDFNDSGATGALLFAQQFTSGTVGTIASNGRGTMTVPINTSPTPYTFDGVFYLTGQNTGFVLDASGFNGNFTLFGTLQPQTGTVLGGPADGNYYGGTIPPVPIGTETTPVHVTAAFLALASGDFTGEQDLNDIEYGPLHLPISGGTYTTGDSFGRATLSVADSPGFGGGTTGTPATIYLVTGDVNGASQFVMLTMEPPSSMGLDYTNVGIGIFTTP